MNKTFSDVFGNIDLKEDVKNIFSDVEIEQIILNDKTSTLKVYIYYDKLVLKSYIVSLEKDLAKNLKNAGVSKVVVKERYTLPENYTSDVWFESYKDSILSELQDYDYVLYTMFKMSDFTFLDENTLSIIAPENAIYREKEKDMAHILGIISNERFNFHLNFDFNYKKATKSRYIIENEKRALNLLEEIKKDISIKEDNYDDITDDNVQVTESNSDTANAIKNQGKEVEKTTENVGTKEITKENIKENTKENTKEKKNKDSGESYYKDKVRSIGGTENKFKKGFGGGDRNKLILSDNPNVIYKQDVEGNAVALEAIQDDIGDVIVQGKVLLIDERFFEKSGKYMCKIEISDFTDSIKIKLFFNEELMNEFREKIKTGDFIMAKGSAEYDTFDRELMLGRVIGIKKIADWREKREDKALKKRVELHLHTKMSDMDAVSDIADIIKQAKNFEHKALAITDHGNVQAFPLGFHALDKGDKFKIIYGVEGYLVNDSQRMIYGYENGANKGLDFNSSFVVFDIETTGFSKMTDYIIEIGAVKVENLKVTGRFSKFVKPPKPIPLRIQKLTSIDDDTVKDAETIETVLPEFIEFIKGSVLVAHNANFDVGFIKEKALELGIDINPVYLDTLGMSRFINTDMNKHTLDALCKKYKVVNEHHHRAVDDAEVTSKIFMIMTSGLIEKGITNLEDMETKGALPREAIARLPYFHIIILAKNEVGRRNLYKLVSESNVLYWNNRPKIPKSRIEDLREGLIIGSACERGEIYQGVAQNMSEAQMADLVDFYDYLEIQPVCNNHYQILSDKFPDINSEEDIRDVNRKIVALGEAYNKPVCATCDVHFLNPEDEVYRRIILFGKGMHDADEQPALYFRTTDEMLAEFEYLGSDKAYEVVVDNTNMIADKVEYITPVRPDKCPPVIQDSDKTLRTICYNKAHEMYGDPLPKIVEDRLEKELQSIIGNGYAVMYIIAQKLVWKSVEDGYLVGSRGSVGSSFVATMSGITEVNPLSPHYYCPKCHYSDFFSEEVRKFAGAAGCDMPDKMCPKCGEKLCKDGFDIPFETFLGFKGDKEPDIDLNFSGEYQSKAHKYTEVIFGAGQTYRAGTIAGLADKTAYGYVKKYYEEHGNPKRDGEINRIVGGCVGIRRTTGQHPGGIVVLPVGEDINSFTPLQKPANDMKTDVVTTHFEYHSIDHNLLKLDILGHDDPTMIRMLQDLTGLDPVTIPLDDPGVMSLFQDLSALKITPDQIGGCELGSLGIPEFGTDFAMGMLKETKPQHFSDLVRIAGLSHGTNVWLGNAQTLLEEGKATISTAICTRDDIMTYLINMGVDPAESFSIMENVRKGKVAKGKCKEWAAWKEDMKAHDVPDWYMWSCERIEYMFPKAHAAAYVMMAWRIAYCKINYPLAFYCAFFSIRAKAFSYETMCMGRARLEQELARLREKEKRGEKDKKEKLTPSEEASIKDLRIVQEMYARGLSFTPIDLYKSKAKYFQIVDGKILPAFVSVEGLGENAAILLEDAAKKGPFISKDDIKQRAKIGQTTIDKLSELGILDGLPETNQLSIFDFGIE